MRRKGRSIKEIAEEVGVSPRTISGWVRDIVLTESQKQTLRDNQIAAGHRGRMMGAEMNRNKKLERIDSARTDAVTLIPSLTPEALFYIGLGLYWGEGSKTESSSLAVTNSDPQVIRLMSRWFIECLEIGKERFMPRVFISDTHRDREEIILKFWAKELDIPSTQFRKTVFLDKGKKIYENRDSYYGVLALRVAKGGDIRHKILACIARISEVA